MPSYSLNPNGLLDSADELTGVTNSIGNAIESLNDIVTVFINTNAGGAAESYRAAQAQWNQGIKEMQAALGSGTTAINNIHDTYKMGDAHGAALFGGNV